MSSSHLQITRRTFLATGVAVAALAPKHLQAALGVEPLLEARCEFLREPLGLQIASPRLTWWPATPCPARQVWFRIIAASHPNGTPDLWDSGQNSSEQQAVLYAGAVVPAHTLAHWRVQVSYSDGTQRSSAWQRWSMGPATEADWHGAVWIGRDDLLENTQETMAGEPGQPKEPPHLPAPYLRHEFALTAQPSAAILHLAAPGYADVRINGKNVDAERERAPGFTNFERRVEYQSVEVSDLLRAGQNAIGVVLGTGWYDVHDVATWHFDTSPWRRRPRLLAVLALNWPDGTCTYQVSGPDWTCGTGGLLRDGIYTGEVFDAREEPVGWDLPGFVSNAWHPVLAVEAPRGKLVPMLAEPVRRCESLLPIGITEPQPNVFVVDMGQNFSGHAQLHVDGPAGATVTMRYGEILNAEGTINTAPIDHFMMKTAPRQPFQQDTYICNGHGAAQWEQRFAYAGFRYVQVTGFPGLPTSRNFRGRFAHADLASAGEFDSSNPVLNRIQQATRYSYLSNAQNIPTDCPQREKNGWTGDAGLAVDTGLANFAAAGFYRKWLEDLRDAQRPDGGLPVIVPTGGWGDGRNWPGELCPPWDSAYAIIAWALYVYTGDRRILERHAGPVQRYVTLLASRRQADGLVPGLGLGDWFPWQTKTSLPFISNAYLFLNLTLLAKMLGTLGDLGGQARCIADAGLVSAAMRRAYFDPTTSRWADGTQTAQSMALQFGLGRQADRAAVTAALVQSVEQIGHLDVGILGAKNLLRALAEGGHASLAFRIATRPDAPSWGHWIHAGATTLWEGWQAGPSYNHIMFGDISAWCFAWLAGIQQEPDSVAFERIVFRPSPIPELQHVSASQLTPRGWARIAWQQENRRVRVQCEIPPGAPARLVLPPGAILQRGFAELPCGKHEVVVILPKEGAA